MKKLKILAIILFVSSGLIAQQATHYYIQITDYFVYSIQECSGNGLQITSNVSAIDEIFNRSHIKEFIKIFPDATDWRGEIYYVVVYNENLEEELSAIEFRSLIPLVEKICPPILTSHIPNDPIYREGRQTDLDLINAGAAWAIAKRYPRVNVAITDTHFDFRNQDLSMTLIGGNNDGSSGYHNHGTFVAGRVGAINSNEIGIASIGGYNTNLYVSTVWGNDMEVLRLARAGFRVINCSWGRCFRTVVAEAIYYDIRNVYNAVVVFGAGNGHHCNGNRLYPASFATTVSVTSVGHKHERGTFIDGVATNWKDVHEFRVGDVTSTHHHNEAVDISAPGYSVYSTWSDTFGQLTGTSFAAPQVAGVAAMIIAINPNLTANEVVEILKNTADSSIYDIPENAPYIGLLGAGRLDAYAAVRAARNTVCVNAFTNQTVTTDRVATGCTNLNIRNVTVTNGATLTVDAEGIVTIDGPFEVGLGSGLKIW